MTSSAAHPTSTNSLAPSEHRGLLQSSSFANNAERMAEWKKQGTNAAGSGEARKAAEAALRPHLISAAERLEQLRQERRVRRVRARRRRTRKNNGNWSTVLRSHRAAAVVARCLDARRVLQLLRVRHDEPLRQVYQDAGLSLPYPAASLNGSSPLFTVIQADGTGALPPMFLNPETIYRVQLYSSTWVS
jgi:hypothetical protein